MAAAAGSVVLAAAIPRGYAGARVFGDLGLRVGAHQMSSSSCRPGMALRSARIDEHDGFSGRRRRGIWVFETTRTRLPRPQ
jgi:hypothetical protein